MREDTSCICKYKGGATWGPWKSNTKTPTVLTPWLLKKSIRQIKCEAAVRAARRRVEHDEDFFQGGEEPDCE